MRARVALILFAVLLLRLPFLNQAIQGDDYNYLAGAMHAQIDPLHPTHARYVFLGKLIDARGHPHPPLNMWVLAGLLAIFGDIREIPFHAAYIAFSVLAAFSMWRLAVRFSPKPTWATLLFLVTPAFVINGNSFEADVPFVAFWMASAALYVHAVDRRSMVLLAGAGVSMALAALTAYQAVVLIPILGAYIFFHRRTWYAGWTVLVAPVAAPAAWQLYERLTTGAFPFSVLAGHLTSYGFQALSSKLQSAVAFAGHTGWLVFPPLVWLAFRRAGWWAWSLAGLAAVVGAILADPHPLFWLSLGTGVLIIAFCVIQIVRRQNADTVFLAVWIAIFFAAAAVLFFAGSARYLLPIAAPVALLVTRSLAGHVRWLAIGCAAQAVIGISLSIVNYQHWDAYRAFIDSIRSQFERRRVWINSEWGLRYYAETAGGLPLIESQPVRPGDLVLTSKIAYPVTFTTGGGMLTPLAERTVTSFIPLRLIGLEAKSSYSTVTLGFRPFDIGFGPIDNVAAQGVIERKPEHSYLLMGAPEAESQIVSGIYQLEGGRTRWMSDRAVILLKAPPTPQPLKVEFYLSDQAPARKVWIAVGGAIVVSGNYDKPGVYTLRSDKPVESVGESVSIEIAVDRAFSVPGDRRLLGAVLIGAGFSE